ncbi:ERVV2 protein, partial [Neopipo cinnamomea]|nr:ERVV2 protein [Neopipo cinnamomea]
DLERRGLCVVINQSCCSYVAQDRWIEKNLQTIMDRAKLLHAVTLDDTHWGFSNLWKKLTSWLPDLGWLKQLFVVILTVIISGILICVFLKCFIWCSKSSCDSYLEWKRHQLRQRVESGSYFPRA